MDTAIVISSAQYAQMPRMDTDRGSQPSRFSGVAYRSHEGLWDPQDIFLAPQAGSGRPGADYRSARFDMAAKYRKVTKTVDSLAAGNVQKANAEESAQTIGPDDASNRRDGNPMEAQAHSHHGEEPSSMMKRLREVDEGLAAAYDVHRMMPISIFEAVAANVLDRDAQEMPANHVGYRLDTCVFDCPSCGCDCTSILGTDLVAMFAGLLLVCVARIVATLASF